MSIQANNNDIIFFGHGSYPGGADTFVLPQGVELYILQPVGYTLLLEVASRLIAQQPISKLALRHDNNRGDTALAPSDPLPGGSRAPDLKLYDLANLKEKGKAAIGAHTNVITVGSETRLSQLLTQPAVRQAIEQAVHEGRTLRVFWAACAAQISGNRAALDKDTI